MKQQQLKKIKEVCVYTMDAVPAAFSLNIEQIRFHKNYALVKFQELNSIDEVIRIKGAFLKAQKSILEEHLEEDEYFIDDLIGMAAVQDDKEIGIIHSVIDIKGDDLLDIRTNDNKKYLVPFLEKFVPEVDKKSRKVALRDIENFLHE